MIYRRQQLENMHQKLGDGTAFCSISTFSGGGIGDAGVEWGAEVPVISACELVPDRAGLIRHNYPSTKVFQGDIWQLKSDIIKHSKKELGGSNPWLFVMSPPCQGMSSNGAGRISASIAAGKRPAMDRAETVLVIPGVEIVEELRPSWFILEKTNEWKTPSSATNMESPKTSSICSGDDFIRWGTPSDRPSLTFEIWAFLITDNASSPSARTFPISSKKSNLDQFSRQIQPDFILR